MRSPAAQPFVGAITAAAEQRDPCCAQDCAFKQSGHSTFGHAGADNPSACGRGSTAYKADNIAIQLRAHKRLDAASSAQLDTIQQNQPRLRTMSIIPESNTMPW